MHVLLFACIYVLQIITKSSSAEGSSRRRLGNTSTCPHMRFDITKLASAASCSWRWLCYMLKRALWASACVAKRTSSVSCSWWWLCYRLSIKYWKYFFFWLHGCQCFPLFCPYFIYKNILLDHISLTFISKRNVIDLESAQ